VSPDVVESLGEIVGTIGSESSSQLGDSVSQPIGVVLVLVDVNHLGDIVMIGDQTDPDVLVVDIPDIDKSLDKVSLVVHVPVGVSPGILEHEHDLSWVASNVIFVRFLGWT